MEVFKRVNDIVVAPKTEWAKIEGEPGDARTLFTRYVAIVAALPPVCGLLDAAFDGRLREGLGAALLLAIVCYALTFVVVYVMGLIADALAPSFGGRRSQPGALKLVVYAKTPVWLVGAFALYPNLGVLSLLALYALYLFWVGASALMKVPSERAALYTAATAVCGIVIYVVLYSVVGAIFGFPLIAASLGSAIYSMM
jgi:hypothetical protein